MKDRTAGLAKCFLGMLAIALVIPLVGAAYAENEGWLGVMLQPLSDDIIAAMDLEKGATGVLVSDVVEGSPAAQADIQNGDVIVEIDGTAISGVDQAVEQVRSHAVGDVVKVVVLRHGKKQVVTATLGDRSKAEEAAPFGEGEKEWSKVLRKPHVERWLKDFKGDLKDFDLGKGGHIGVRIQDITADLAPYFGVGKDEGVLILEVIEGSPAAEAGLRGGDVVVKVDGKPVCCSGPFVEAIRGHEPGDKVEITFRRQGETRRLDVEVGEGPRLFEKFLGDAGAPGAYLWEEGVPGGQKRMVLRIGDEDWSESGEGPGCIDLGDRKCIIIGDRCCKGMMGRGMHKCEGMGECKQMCMMMCKDMDECMQMCRKMGEQCKGATGKDMEECMKKCQMIKERCEGMMGRTGEGAESSMSAGEGPCRIMIKQRDDDPVKSFMMQSETKGDLKAELQALRQEIEDLKKEIERLRE